MLTENSLFKILLPINEQLNISTLMLHNRNKGDDKRQIVLHIHMIIQLAVGTSRSCSKQEVTHSIHRLQTTCSSTGIRTETVARIWGKLSFDISESKSHVTRCLQPSNHKGKNKPGPVHDMKS